MVPHVMEMSLNGYGQRKKKKSHKHLQSLRYKIQSQKLSSTPVF